MPLFGGPVSRYRVFRGWLSVGGGGDDDRRHVKIFFADASLECDSDGINLPPVLAAEVLHLDSLPGFSAAPRGATSSFCFGEDDHTRFFSPQSLEADTVAFARSLKSPESNPLLSKDYRLQDKNGQFVSVASAYAARLAAFSTALVDLLIRADELEVSEEDKGSIHTILLDLSALNFSQVARIKLHATKRRRHLALDCLKLPKEFNDQAVDRVSRAGPQIFGGKFLEAVDTDLTMKKRAKEVADRFKPRQSGLYIVFAADGLPSLRAKGALVPDSGDDPAFSSLDTGEAIDLLPPIDLPPP